LISLNNYRRATGVTTAVVESMERSFKHDVLHELRAGGGRILLHDEVEERPGVFSIIPLWETVFEDDILTPRDVMELVAKEGYKVGFLVLSFTSR
jgi:Inositol hexakisphosphate